MPVVFTASLLPCSNAVDTQHKEGGTKLQAWLAVYHRSNRITSLPRTIDAKYANTRYFISYLKKPDNNERWHDGKIEQGNDADWVGDNRDGAAEWI